MSGKNRPLSVSKCSHYTVAASQALGRAYDDALVSVAAEHRQLNTPADIAGIKPWVFPMDKRMVRVLEIYDRVEVLYAELNDLLDELMPRKKRHVRKKR